MPLAGTAGDARTWTIGSSARMHGLILLVRRRPLTSTVLDPGYIKGYAPGVRENGGQYTHAALWVVQAFAMLGDGDRAGALFRMLNPIDHCPHEGGRRSLHD